MNATYAAKAFISSEENHFVDSSKASFSESSPSQVARCLPVGKPTGKVLPNVSSLVYGK